MEVGGILDIEVTPERRVPCEVVGFSGERALAMPFGSVQGLRRGRRAIVALGRRTAPVRGPGSLGPRRRRRWASRLDGGGPLPHGAHLVPYRGDPPSAHARRRLGEPLDLGVRVLNAFVAWPPGPARRRLCRLGRRQNPCCSPCSLARSSAADVSAIGLVGERGREVQEFLQEDLGPQGLRGALGRGGRHLGRAPR
jgi:flagellum-specific ATP synthase